MTTLPYSIIKEMMGPELTKSFFDTENFHAGDNGFMRYWTDSSSISVELSEKRGVIRIAMVSREQDRLYDILGYGDVKGLMWETFLNLGDPNISKILQETISKGFDFFNG